MAQTGIGSTEQALLNSSFDPDTGVLVVMPVGFDGSSAVKSGASAMAVKIVESGTTTYIAKAAVGSSTSSAVWQAKKLDASSGLVVTWADGNANFDNAASNLASLSYS